MIHTNNSDNNIVMSNLRILCSSLSARTNINILFIGQISLGVLNGTKN